jgi:hypothetical protein
VKAIKSFGDKFGYPVLGYSAQIWLEQWWHHYRNIIHLGMSKYGLFQKLHIFKHKLVLDMINFWMEYDPIKILDRVESELGCNICISKFRPVCRSWYAN